MNEYERQLAALMCQRCDICSGSGQNNDAEAGDMYFKTWDCTNCGASGMEPDKAKVEKRLKEKDLYPCVDCGTLRTKAEGGTTFTVCDECYDNIPKSKFGGIVTGDNTKMCDKCLGFHKGLSCEEHKANIANGEHR